MQPSCGIIFIFLLARLQWNKCNTVGTKAKEISVTDNNQSTVQPASRRVVLSFTTTINAPATSHAAPTAASAKINITKRTEMSSQSKSTPLRSTDGTTLSSNVTVLSKGGINKSATNFSGIPVSLATFTSVGDFSGATKSAAAVSTSTVTPSNSTFTYSAPSAEALPSDNPSTNPSSLFPTSIALTSTTVQKDSPTPNFNSTQQTTELNHNFSSNSTASSNSKDANEEKTNKGGVIVGVIVGAILVSILIGLIGYFICGKKRSESFSHRRLYDDTRNEPVFHLDNSLRPYDTSFGGALDDKTSTADKAKEDSPGSPSDGIPMADMTPSHLSP